MMLSCYSGCSSVKLSTANTRLSSLLFPFTPFPSPEHVMRALRKAMFLRQSASRGNRARLKYRTLRK